MVLWLLNIFDYFIPSRTYESERSTMLTGGSVEDHNAGSINFQSTRNNAAGVLNDPRENTR